MRVVVSMKKFFFEIEKFYSSRFPVKDLIKVEKITGYFSCNRFYEMYLGLHRKTGKLDAASSYHRRALEINPKHKGALENEGELFLIRGNKDRAKVNLA